MNKKLIFIMIWLASAAFAVPAEAGLVTVIHALPALPGAVPSSNPVDIAIDGVCEHTYQPYGAKLGPKQIEAGWHSIIFYESIPDDPCRGKVLAAIEGWVSATDEIDVVLHLNSEDQVVISTWDNTTALDAIDSGAEAAVEVRHAAAGPILSAVLKKENDVVEVGGVQAGSILGPIETTEGEHTLQIKKGEENLDQDTGVLKEGRVYWVYVTGSVFKKTVDLLTIESIPDELIEGEDPGPPKFSTCCLYGTAVQLGQNQCQSLGGTFIGDIDPSRNPCQGIP
ncbi:MAG: hypothetical protein JSV16_03135 [Candidatus Hydrogenedentota bacterium]|nr:MAG: hypothetical protein JSV16_03135 [Candidatus Hydrogenedentota bacterium]